MQLFVSLFGVLVTLLVLLNIKTTNKSNLFLIFFLILINLFNVIMYSTMLSDNKYLVAIFIVHFSPLIILTGPMLFFYVRSLISDDAKLTKKDLIHFIPALLYFINNFNYNFLFTFEQKLNLAQRIITENRELMLNYEPLLFAGNIVYILRSLISLFYAIVCTVMVYKHYRGDIRRHFQNVLIFRWLVLLLFFNYTMNFSIVYYVAKLLYYWKLYSSFTIVPMGALIFGVVSLTLINLTLFFFPSILYGLPRMDYFLLTPNKFNPELPLNNLMVKSIHTKEFEISNEKLELIGIKVDQYCEEKPYLNQSFTLAFMSKEVGIPIHHLSYYFNEYLKTDFASWKNNIRIDYVIDLINKGSSQLLTLEALSKQAGFVSRSTFVNAFKKKMSKTPSEYLNSIK